MKKFYCQFLLAFLSIFMLNTAWAQETTVSGTVTDQTTGETLAGVNVVVKGSTTGTITNIDGAYKLSVPSDATLIFSFIGYLSQEEPVNGRSTIDVGLTEDITNLEEVVITGLASSVKRSNLANAVATVSADQLVGTTKSQTIDNALYGKLPGVNIKSTSGAPGGGVQVQLRGLSTVSNGNSQPLYIIDGVYVNNTATQTGISVANGAGSGQGRGLQDDIANRLADINPEDIESVEVLKGPSAAAIYGTRANAGVIIINTKRGTQGRTKISVNQEFGFNQAVNLLGFDSWDANKINTHFGGSQQRLNDLNSGRNTDLEEEIYGENGFISNTGVTVSGGSDKTTFYINGSHRSEDGIIKNTGFERSSVRANIGHKLTDKIKINSNSNYIRSTTNRGFTGNQNGTGASLGYNLSFTPPYADLFPDSEGNYPDNVYFSENPLALRDKSVNQTDVNRFIQAFDIEVDLLQTDLSFLKFTAQGGLDFTSSNAFVYLPEDLQHQRNSQNPGDVFQGRSDQLNTNLQAFLIFNTNLSSINLNTQVGFVKLTEDSENIIVRGQGLRNGQTNASTADIRTIFLQNDLRVRDFGFIAQEEINWEDKIIGTLGVRFDRSTLNLDQEKFYAFPKASIAVNVSNFDFWNVDFVNQFKLRAAYGETGGLPRFGTTFTQLNSVFLGSAGGNTLSTTTVDPDLRPETASEIELGFDLGVFNNRAQLEFTWYNKQVFDLIESLVPANSTGITAITTNAGTLQNTGIEIGLSGSPIRNSNFEWFSRVLYWSNEMELTEWNVPTSTRGGFGATLGTYELAEGQSPTTIVGTPELTDAQGNPTGRFTVYGDANPDYQMSFFNSLKYKNFEFSFLFDHSSGNDNINLSEFLWDLGGTAPDWSQRDLFPNQTAPNGVARPADQGANGPGIYIQDASYWKLREVGLYYRVPTEALTSVFNGAIRGAKVGLSGNHLFIWSDYRSYDPEVSQFSQDPVASSVEVTPFPSARRLMFHLTLDF